MTIGHQTSTDTLVAAGRRARAAGDAALAERCYREALALAPGSLHALLELGALYAEAGQYLAAVPIFERALRLRPDSVELLADLTHLRQQLCDWSGLEAAAAAIRRHVTQSPHCGVSPFFFMMLPGSTAREQRLCAEKWLASRLPQAAARRAALGFSFARPAAPRLRVGYLSADFHEHATLRLLAPVLEAHDRRRYEIVLFSYGRAADDALRRRALAACDAFVDLRALGDEDAARAIHARGIEVLVDAKGYSRGARPGILALRPAPVQVAYLVYPGTSGGDFLDYLIADRTIVPPAHAGAYSERVLHLDGAYHCTVPPAAAGAAPSRADCGLPATGFVYACFNQAYKIAPAVFDVWCRLLAATPGSVLWLWASNPWAGANLRREAAARGVDPRRLVMAPLLAHAQHLARLALADLFLDTLPCNAHTTASDALAAGVPLVTCSGETFVSRVAASLLASVGVPELAAASLERYEALALGLARDPAALGALRARLRAARAGAPLFDPARLARDLERLYQAMWRASPGAAAGGGA